MQTVLKFAFSAISLIAGPLSVNAFAAPPNVIFILADDIGYSDVSAYNEYISGVDPVLPTFPIRSPTLTDIESFNR